jgi:hypothetical protein
MHQQPQTPQKASDFMSIPSILAKRKKMPYFNQFEILFGLNKIERLNSDQFYHCIHMKIIRW